MSRQKQKRLEAEAAEAARIEREGIAVLRLQMSDLFAKRTVISTKVSQTLCPLLPSPDSKNDPI